MKDRFKFRIWEVDNSRYRINKNCNPVTDFLLDTQTGEIQTGEGFEVYGNDISELVLEQCTGVKDIKGRLIYEGDIVSSSNRVMGIQRIGVIEYHYDGFVVTYHDGNGGHCIMNMCEPIEIIGNVHEEGYKEIVEELE